MKHKQSGYIILTLALIVSGIGAAIAANLVLRATDDAQTGDSVNKAAKAQSLASACLEHALVTLKNHKSYGGDETVVVENGEDNTDGTSDDKTCRVLTVTGTGNTDRTIQAQATVRGTTKYKEAQITQINPSLTISARKTRNSLPSSALNTDNPWRLKENNLTLWLKASGLLQNDDSSVSEWVGHSNQELTVDQNTSADKPTFRTQSLNGRPTVEFDGDDSLSRSGTTLDTLVKDDTASVFAVQKQDGSSAENTTFALQPSHTANRFLSHLDFNDTLYFDFGDTGSGGRISTPSPSGWDDTYHLVELFRDGSNGVIRVDNTTELSDTFSDTLDTSTSDTLYVGTSKNSNGVFKGQIAEILVFDAALSDSEKSRIRNYLNIKYNLY